VRGPHVEWSPPTGTSAPLGRVAEIPSKSIPRITTETFTPARGNGGALTAARRCRHVEPEIAAHVGEADHFTQLGDVAGGLAGLS
jgi:hypothetical protein